ncbi:small subunit rRNA processing factor, putative [Plasmodium sp. DRC-Itaito]|nr:small subunit rRNA processing factor, putative [Plasmodium sp. DRC-Itaito]
MAKKKNNYLMVDTNNIKFTENSESEDIDVEEYDDNDVDDSNIDKDDISSSDENDDDEEEDDSSDDNEEENINDDLDEESKKDKKNNKDDYVKISWEKDKKNYYQYESENSSSDDDEEENNERLKEAIYLNKKEKENLEENDFDLYNIYDNDNKDNKNVKENIIKKLINDMNNELKEKKQEITLENKDKQEEIKELVMSEQQEYLILLKELSLNIEKVFNEIKENQKLFEFKDINEKNVPSSDINKNTLLYLKKKNETMLTYIIYITYYVFLKVMNSYTPTHPVLDKLIYMNTIISKTNELDNKIKFKIQQLNKSGDKSVKQLNGVNGKELQEDTYDDDEEERDINVDEQEEDYDEEKEDNEEEDDEEEDDEEDDDDDEEDDDDDDDEEDDDDDDEDDDDDDEDDDDDDEDDDNDDDDDDDDDNEEEEEEGYNEQKKDLKNKKYKISKSLITEYTDSHIREKEKEEKKKKREKIRNEKNIFVKEIKDMISNRPEKIEEENYLKKMEEKYMDFDEKMLNKKMKELSKKKNKMKNLTNVGMTTNDLLKFVELPEMNEQNDQKNNKFDEKKIFRSNINKIKQIKKNKLEHNPNDDFVSYKKFDKNKQKTFNTNEYMDQQNNIYGKKKIHDEIDDEHIKNMLNFKDMKKEKRKKYMDEKNKQIRKKLVDEENEEVDRRMPNQKIMQNKGLVRKRKSTDGNARVHNRFKYMKKMKVYNSQHAKLKVHDNNYSGEKRGINPYLKKSVDIK